MTDDPFRRWIAREVSEMDHAMNKDDPRFQAFLKGIVNEKVELPPIGKFYSHALQICKSLGLSMTYEKLEWFLYTKPD